ncbi:hypothetical protein JTB14_009795 [Gonioctena quinquepunctata]|nr:hypothetical protein JTB14_009795 [Gonioctena quinquepunctata]
MSRKCIVCEESLDDGTTTSTVQQKGLQSFIDASMNIDLLPLAHKHPATSLSRNQEKGRCHLLRTTHQPLSTDPLQNIFCSYTHSAVATRPPPSFTKGRSRSRAAHISCFPSGSVVAWKRSTNRGVGLADSPGEHGPYNHPHNSSPKEAAETDKRGAGAIVAAEKMDCST